jgi:hypothetical protein
MKPKKFFAIFILLIGYIYFPNPVSAQNLTWDENGFCWKNCPTLDAGAYIQSFTQIRGLSGYLRLPEVVNAPTQIRGLRIGINNPNGNFWTATGTLIHQGTGTRYPIGLATSSDGNPLGWYNQKCSSTNICSPDFSFGPLWVESYMYAGSYHLEIVVKYSYGLNPTWSKVIDLPGALVIASSPAGLGALPTPTTSTTVSLPTIVTPVVPRGPATFGGRCPYRYGRTRINNVRAVCTLVSGKLVWRRL